MGIVRFVLLLVACFLLTQPTWAASPDDLGEQSELFWRALEVMGLEHDEMCFDMQDFSFYNTDKYRLKMLDTFFSDPWKISPYTRMMTDQLLSQGSMSDVVCSAQSKINHGVRLNIGGYATLGAYRPRLAEHGENNLAVALAELTGKPAEEYRTAEYNALPPAVRDAAALFCFTLPEVVALRDSALVEPIAELGLEPQEVFDRAVEWAIAEPDEDPDGRYVRGEAQLMERLLDSVDWDRLNAGATLLADCVDEVYAMLTAEGGDLGTDYKYFVDTPLGGISIVNGSDVCLMGSQRNLFILDLSGDDYYVDQGATLDWENPVSVLIDLAGDDTYSQGEGVDYQLAKYYDTDSPDYTGAEYTVDRQPRFGCGVLGYGVVLDASGDDTYECQWLGQGSGVLGTGVLWDIGGDDYYNGIGGLQGSGTMGTGILRDGGGDDHYECYIYSQGFGYTNSVGILLDKGDGTDKYIANNTEIVYDGPHSPVINLNLSQGFGYGRRDDLGEGHSWMGGIGILADGGGDDVYDCGIYALGGAYWGGIGVLTDKGGNDSYMSAHYTLAAPPHYALGVFQDDAGDDVYFGYLRQAIGHGRDWSIGWFEDSAGNDWYQAGHQSIGQGDVNSIGVFWDKDGDDTYLIHGPGFGQTTTAGSSVPRTGAPGSIRWFQLCVGLFIDGGGEDRYLQVPEEVPFFGEEAELTPDPDAADGKIWIKGDSIAAPNSHSVGIDAE